MYDILWTETAKKKLSKLDKSTMRRIIKAIGKLKKAPEKFGKHLLYRPFWSLRVGKYRVIYSIERSQVKIVAIGLRDSIYKS